MVRASLLFLVIAVIGLTNLQNFLTAFTRDWTNIELPPFTPFSFTQLIWLCLLPVVYFVLEKTGKIIGKRLIHFHLVFTLFYFLEHNPIWYMQFEAWLPIFAPHFLFFIGQLVFVIGCIRAFLRPKSLNL